MPRPTGPTDPNLAAAIKKLRKNYPAIARRLSRPRRSKKAVNVGRLDKAAKNNEAIAVTGKVLSAGEISKAINVYAWQFSKQAKEKITKAGGKCLSIEALAESKEKVRVLA